MAVNRESPWSMKWQRAQGPRAPPPVLVLAVLVLLLHVALDDSNGVAAGPSPSSSSSPLFASDTHHYDSLLIRFLHEYSQQRPKGSAFYPPVLPINELNSLGHESRYLCSDGKLSLGLKGRWYDVKARHKSALHRTLVYPLMEPVHDCCLLGKSRPTLVDATVLRGKPIYFLGDSHIRYLYNYFLDFLEGPCEPDVYMFPLSSSGGVANGTDSATGSSPGDSAASKTTGNTSGTNTSSPYDYSAPSWDPNHRDNGYDLRSSCGGRRASESKPFRRTFNVTTQGGVYGDHRARRNTTVDAHFVWAPRQSPFKASSSRNTEECLKEFTQNSPKYLMSQLGTTCKSWGEHLGDILAKKPLAVIISISEIEIELNTTMLISNFDIPVVHDSATKIILFNHKHYVKSDALAISHALGLTLLDVTGVAPPQRLRDRVHLGGPAGAVASRALFWALHGIASGKPLK